MARTPSRPRRLLLGLAAVGLALVACEDADDTFVTAATTTTPTTDPPLTTQPSAATTAPSTTSVTPVGEDGVLRIGSLLPETGSLAAFGPPLIEAVELAVIDVNATGGVLGQPVELLAADSGSDADVGAAALMPLLDGGADVVVGPAVSGVARRVFDTITTRPSLSCLPSITASDIGVAESPFALRTAPSDDLQVVALAELAEADGATSVSLLAAEDERGLRFVSGLVAELTEREIALGAEETFDPDGPEGGDAVQAVVDAAADVVIVIGALDAAPIVAELTSAGVDGGSILVTDGLATPQLAERAAEDDPSAVAGVRGTVPTDAAPSGGEFFAPAFAEYAGDIDTFFAAQAYDCVAVVALAAIGVSATDPVTLSDAVVDVTVGGTPCETIADCVALLGAGEDIDYIGASGVDLDEGGEAAGGVFDVFAYGDDGAQEPLDPIGVGPAAEALAGGDGGDETEEGDLPAEDDEGDQETDDAG